MTRRLLACGLMLAACTAARAADAPAKTEAPNPGLERLKKLAGT